MIDLFDSFDNVIGRPFADMTDAHKRILAAQAKNLGIHAQAVSDGRSIIASRLDGGGGGGSGGGAPPGAAAPAAAPGTPPAKPTPAPDQTPDRLSRGGGSAAGSAAGSGKKSNGLDICS